MLSRRNLTPAERSKIVEMKNSGKSYREIAGNKHLY